MWFGAENHTDSELLGIIKDLREAGTPVYIATNQEKYRAKYLQEIMFPNVFDGMFISSEIGYQKKDKEYWVSVLGRLAIDIPGIEPGQIAFFDDSQDSIDRASTVGINAFLYQNAEQVKKAL